MSTQFPLKSLYIGGCERHFGQSANELHTLAVLTHIRVYLLARKPTVEVLIETSLRVVVLYHGDVTTGLTWLGTRDDRVLL